jgi:hypothetical protein
MAVVCAPFLRGSFAWCRHWRFRHANAACILRAFVGRGCGAQGRLRALAVADGGAGFLFRPGRG